MNQPSRLKRTPLTDAEFDRIIARLDRSVPPMREVDLARATNDPQMAEAHQVEDEAAVIVTRGAMWAIGFFAAVPLLIAAVLWSMGQ